MKKRIVLAILAAVMVFVLAACQPNVSAPTTAPTDPPATYPVLDKVSAVEPSKNAAGAYVLTQPGHVAYMAEHPAENYVLGADIDMGGAGWTPIADFSGKLDGNIHKSYHYTISNLTVQVPEGASNAGFFGNITGEVKNVIFKDINVVSIYTFTGNMGIVAGQSAKDLSNVEVKNGTLTAAVKDSKVGAVCGSATTSAGCFASGVMNVTLEGGKSYVGGILGYASGAASNLDSRVAMNITGSAATAGAAGGTVGFAAGKISDNNYGGKLNVTAKDNTFAAGTLVGELNAALENSQNCAEANTITGAAQQADAYCGVLGANGAVTGCVTRDPKTFESAIPAAEYALRQEVVDYMYRQCTYRWIPVKDMEYDDCSCNGGKGHPQSFKAGTMYFGPLYSHLCLSLEAALSVVNPDYTLKDSVPATGFNQIFGNDCADSVYWALSNVSAEITYGLTSDAFANMTKNGLYPVGTYTLGTSTQDTCAINGAEVMYEALAQVKMGDPVLGPGHIRLAAENAYVFRDANGKIDPARSYILIHEQGAVSMLQENHSTCRVFYKLSFEDLFTSNYIPITIKAYTEGEDEIEITCSNTALDKSGLCMGGIVSNYRINNVTMRITDSKGVAVMDKTNYITNSNTNNSDSYSLYSFKSSLREANLTVGEEYTYELFVFVSGENVLVQTFKFVN